MSARNEEYEKVTKGHKGADLRPRVPPEDVGTLGPVLPRGLPHGSCSDPGIQYNVGGLVPSCSAALPQPWPCQACSMRSL